MNPGAVEEGSKVASSLIESLKAQPMTLALVVFNMIFIGAVVYANAEQRKLAHEETLIMLAQQKQMSEWLYRCTPTGQQQHTKMLEYIESAAPAEEQK
jgi:cbb3-type cytochrome oxidase subunit 3